MVTGVGTGGCVTNGSQRCSPGLVGERLVFEPHNPWDFPAEHLKNSVIQKDNAGK